MTLLNLLESGPLRDRLLAGIADGSLIVGTAWQQTAGQTGACSGPAVAVDGHGQAVSGSFVNVSPATGASGWLSLARVQDDDVLLWIEAGADGVQMSDLPRVDSGSLARCNCRHAMLMRHKCLRVGPRCWLQ